MTDHDDALANPAALIDRHSPGEPTTPDCCDDNMVFGLRDRYHDFSLGITTVLACLRFAERSGEVPELGADWWLPLTHRYPDLQALIAEQDTPDSPARPDRND